MSKARSHAMFGLGVILPLVLLFWPFAVWNGIPALLLRVIPAAVLQYLFCRRANRPWVEAAPLLAASALALWGIFLFFTSAHWANATAWGLILDYCSPALAAAAVWLRTGYLRPAKDLCRPVFVILLAALLVAGYLHLVYHPIIISNYELTDSMRRDIQNMTGGFHSIGLPLAPTWVSVMRAQDPYWSVRIWYFPFGTVELSRGSDGYSIDKALKP